MGYIDGGGPGGRYIGAKVMRVQDHCPRDWWVRHCKGDGSRE